MDFTALTEFMARGGPALWVIAALSVTLVAVSLWRVTDLVSLGLWRRVATTDWPATSAPSMPQTPRTPRDRMTAAALTALNNSEFDVGMAHSETTRVAKAELMELRRGTRPLELIATIAPLVGLLGTVLGMIEAFQSLQQSGSGADPSVLAGGIWQALLTTAAGMAVAIPASMMLSWIESLAEREQARMEDLATRIFNAAPRLAKARRTDTA